MAELVIRVVDKLNADPALDRGCTKAGDVVERGPDGTDWGRMVVANPAYVIVQIPNTAPAQFDDMVKPLFDSDGNLVLKRAMQFSATVAKALATAGGGRVTLSATAVQQLLATRKAKQSPAKIVLK